MQLKYLPKYDRDSYIKYPKINIVGDRFTPLESPLTKGNLLIKWYCQKQTIVIPGDAYKVSQDKNSIALDSLMGICEKRVTTPIGDLFPEQFKLKVAVRNDKLIQFLELTNIDTDYTLYFQNPPSVNLSFLEVWESKL